MTRCLSRLKRMECDSLRESEPSLEVFWRGEGKGFADERINVNVKKKYIKR